MSKHSPTKPHDPKQVEASITAANSGDADVQFPRDGSLSEGDGVILTMGSGIPTASPLGQRQQLIAAANAGDAGAQCRMGDKCRTGDEFTKQDFAEALRWYRLAAAQGDPNAQNNIGALYQNGMGVPKDMPEAAQWYRQSAGQDLSTAQFNLGECYLYGNGVNEDEHEAAAWLHKAAEQGHIEALSELGDLYRWGHGVEKRIAIAAEMHTIAALAGDASAIANLADYHSEIESEALSGRMLAALCLAKMYDRGLGVEANKITEFAWLLWGYTYGNRNEDPDAAEELDAMKAFYSMVIPPANDERDQQGIRSRRPRWRAGVCQRRGGGVSERGGRSSQLPR